MDLNQRINHAKGVQEIGRATAETEKMTYEGREDTETNTGLEGIENKFEDAPNERQGHIASKSRKKLGRTVQIMTRLTPDEEQRLRAWIERSGRRQGDYLRDVILTGHVYEVPTEAIKAEALIETKRLSAEIGKATGMLKQTISTLKQSESLDEYVVKRLIIDASAAIKNLNSYNSELRKEINKWQY